MTNENVLDGLNKACGILLSNLKIGTEHPKWVLTCSAVGSADSVARFTDLLYFADVKYRIWYDGNMWHVQWDANGLAKNVDTFVEAIEDYK